MKNYFGIFIFLVLLMACNKKKKVIQNLEYVQSEQIKRFFSDDSFWNQPIPEHAELDSKSDYWISLLERDPSGENVG